jgi:hypothetical protein
MLTVTRTATAGNQPEGFAEITQGMSQTVFQTCTCAQGCLQAVLFGECFRKRVR